MLVTASECGHASDDLSMTPSEMATLPTRVAHRDVDGCSECYEHCDEQLRATECGNRKLVDCVEKRRPGEIPQTRMLDAARELRAMTSLSEPVVQESTSEDRRYGNRKCGTQSGVFSSAMFDVAMTSPEVTSTPPTIERRAVWKGDSLPSKHVNFDAASDYCRARPTGTRPDYDYIARVVDKDNTARVLKYRVNWDYVYVDDCAKAFDYDYDYDCVDLNIEADPVRRVESESTAILIPLASTERASTPEECVLRDGDCREPGRMSSPVVEPDARVEARSIEATEPPNDENPPLRREIDIPVVKMTLTVDVCFDTTACRRVESAPSFRSCR